VALISALILSGCAGTRPSHTEISWPPPPQEPKIVYVEAIYGSSSLSRGLLTRIKDFFFGKPDETRIGKPYGVKQDNRERLYIADTSRKGILVIDRSSGRTTFFNSLGAYGTLSEPVYVITDSLRNIYVADTKLGKIVVFNKHLRFSHFIGEGHLEGPVGLAFDRDEKKLYVVDTQLHQVKIFDRDGQLSGTIGQRGDERGQFHFPLTVAFGRSGDTLYIVDSFHFAVQAFDLDGNYLFSFGPTKVGMGTMARPRDIAIDSEGHVYVTDAVRNNVQIYDSQGNLLLRFGSAGTEAGQFRLPAGICIDDDDTIYISDSVNGRIQVFRYVGT
jgi:DNA-binding beta-propeller fold protein YncE